MNSLEFTEVEYKYQPKNLKRHVFLARCRALSPRQRLVVSGPDTYYGSRSGHILRWRHSADKDELTTKYRTDPRNSLVRRETDIDVSGNSVKTIIRHIQSIGFKKLFRIYKDCHIFWYRDRRGAVSVVYYTVRSKNQPDSDFVEIEVEKNQYMSIDDAKDLVVQWEKALGLSPQHRINKTLYEIYSGRKTPVLSSSKRRKPTKSKRKAK